MSDERDPVEEQQIAGDPYDSVQTGEVAPAIDAVGMGQEDPEGTDLDSVWISTDDEENTDEEASS